MKNAEDNSETVVQDLADCSREDLIEKIRKLSLHVKQLRNVIRRDEKSLGNDSYGDLEADRPIKKPRKDRPFDFSKHPKRHVALKIAYLGWDYQGLAVQDDTIQTIEHFLFDAFSKAKLIESRSTSNYNRCGRTDKGVSAFTQVVSIDLRCKFRRGKGVISQPSLDDGNGDEKEDNLEDELDYCKMLNGLLPKDIRVLAWAPVRPDFSARFDCNSRTYKYFLPIGNANIETIKEAASYLVGEHDFQNFCKLDNSCPDKTTMRRIISVRVKLCDEESSSTKHNPYNLCEVEIHGSAFLWHQIRCIMSVLILVGQGKERPEIVKDLLDIDKTPKKPQYGMATDFPLVLFSTSHGEKITDWICNHENYHHVMSDLQAAWSQQSVKARMVMEMIKSMEKDMTSSYNSNHSEVPENFWIRKPRLTLPYDFPTNQLDSLITGAKTKNYKSLLERPVCSGKQEKK